MYNSAIIGLGNIAWRFDKNNSNKATVPLTHASTLDSDHRTRVVGGVSIDEKDRRDFESTYNAPAYKTLDELFAYIRPDLVSICSPTGLHFEHTLYCLERAVPMIWLEKPPAGSLAELDSLIVRQKASGRSKVLVNYPRRYSEMYRKLRQIHAANTYGRTIMMHITYSRGLVLNGSHMIDLAFYMAGDHEKASLDKVMGFSSPENPSFSFSFSNGLPVIVTGMDLSYQCAEITLIFEHGRVAILYAGAEGRIEVEIEHELFPGFYRLQELKDISFTPKGPSDYFPQALNDLIESFERDRQPRSNLETARKSQALWEEVLNK